MPADNSDIQSFVQDRESIIAEWMDQQLSAISQQGVISRDQLSRQCTRFIDLLIAAPSIPFNATNEGWSEMREFLDEVSSSRSEQGFTPTETALFVFSLKPPLFRRVRTAESSGADTITMIVRIGDLLDQLGLYTTDNHQRSRESVIRRQQQDLMELSTPVVKLWDGILALPLVGTLDSARTLVVMESLLQKIVETSSEIAIIDITGVPTVDTLVAQHLLKTVTAARLMGAECIISGIRPQIAQTLVHLGVNLGQVSTRANMADAFRLALQHTRQEAGLLKPV
jgi:rsbT co-antagonist protein RsbR